MPLNIRTLRLVSALFFATDAGAQTLGHMMAEQFESRIKTPLSDSTGTRVAFIAMFGDCGVTRGDAAC